MLVKWVTALVAGIRVHGQAYEPHPWHNQSVGREDDEHLPEGALFAPVPHEACILFYIRQTHVYINAWLDGDSSSTPTWQPCQTACGQHDQTAQVGPQAQAQSQEVRAEAHS